MHVVSRLEMVHTQIRSLTHTRLTQTVCGHEHTEMAPKTLKTIASDFFGYFRHKNSEIGGFVEHFQDCVYLGISQHAYAY